MADSPERIAAALRYLQEQTPAKPLEGVNVAGLKEAYERQVQPIINNLRQEFATGGVLGALLRAYGTTAAPAQAAIAKGMGIPYQGPMTASRQDEVSSGENFRPMGDAVQQIVGNSLGDPMNLVPMVGPAARGVVTAAKAAAPRIARGLEQHMVNTGGILPMDTWHGSPHRFPPTAKNPLGEFDQSLVGTGEGAQAYGVGAGYLAEAKGLAKSYQEKLAKPSGELSLDGKPVNWLQAFKAARPYMEKSAYADLLDTAKYKRQFGADSGSPFHSWLNNEGMQVLNDAFAGARYVGKSPGYLYKVDLPDEHIAKMLDWDKPLSQQSLAVQKILLPYQKEIGGSFGTGEQTLKAIAFERRMKGLDDSQSAVSQQLREMGIPGIRYLDQGSRAAGKGTSNFVVFDPAHMNILERNGVTAASLRKNVAPQDEALRLAQQRAALPVEQHGLGLPAGNTPQQRADVMFPTDAYHGSGQELKTIDNEKIIRNAYGKGLHSAADPELANVFANHSKEGQNIAPLRLNLGNQASKQDYKDAMRQQWDETGHDATKIRQKLIDRNFDTVTYNHGDFWYPENGKLIGSAPNQDLSYASLIPDNIRSRFAAFDPWRRNSALAAALGVAAPDLLAEEK